VYIKPTIYGPMLFFPEDCKSCSGLKKGWGLSALLMLFCAPFGFNSVIYCNFCSCWFSFIYWRWFVVVLHLEDHLNLFRVIFVLMKLFTFLWNSWKKFFNFIAAKTDQQCDRCFRRYRENRIDFSFDCLVSRIHSFFAIHLIKLSSLL